jgi:hypothetical protein
VSSDSDKTRPFECVIETSKGPVGVLANAVDKGDTLSLQDVTIFAEGRKTGLTREILAARSELERGAKALGFNRLEITGERSLTSSAATPGREVHFSKDLSSVELRPDPAFGIKAHSVVMVAQEVNRLKALEKTYQSRAIADKSKPKPKDRGKEYE